MPIMIDRIGDEIRREDTYELVFPATIAQVSVFPDDKWSLKLSVS